MMSFWSGETLLARLPNLISPFRQENIDCAAYRLTIGHETYVSPTRATPDPHQISKRRLRDGESFTIPPGQFAFLLTHEQVSIPENAIGFISIRAKTKFRGLVNVSGFHVDPGFVGRLIFSVFNAGPATIHLEQGQPIFLIWYADLDMKSSKIRSELPQEGIAPELINNVSDELLSFKSLNEKINESEQAIREDVRRVEKELLDKVHKIEHDHTRLMTTGAILLSIFVSLATLLFNRSCPNRDASEPPSPKSPASMSVPSATPATPTPSSPSTPSP